LKELDTNTPIIVFGSFANFKTEKKSDLDLLVLTKEKLPTHLIPYKVHKLAFTQKTFTKALETNESFIKEVKNKHILLNNHSFYVNSIWSQNGK